MIKYRYNFIIFCKTYNRDFERFKILKESIDKFNQDNIPFYVICPRKDIELFTSLKNNNEKYDYIIISDEEVLSMNKNDNHEQTWRTQQIIKLAFANQNISKFYLIIDSDSYFIKNFYIRDFLFDDETPYIVMHEGKYIKEIVSITNNNNVFELGEKIKKYFKRNGKDYQFLTTPIVFSSDVIKELQKKHDIKELLSVSPLEAYWHGEFLLYSNLIPFKPCEPFFKCFNYQVEYKIWKKIGELESDIARNYLGIVMQNRWVKNKVFKNNFFSYYNRKITRLQNFINLDRKYKKHNLEFYISNIKDFIKEIFKGVK